MRRYWVEASDLSSQEVGGTVTLTGETLHHIRDVCRQGVGDRFEVLASGQAFLVEVIQNSKKEMKAKIQGVREIEILPYPRIRLALAIPRFSVFESVLEKMVEMGVEDIQPVFSDNSFLKKDERTWTAKSARFEKIITSATQQCGRGERMRLLPARPLAEFLDELGTAINRGEPVSGLFAYEVGTVPIKAALKEASHMNQAQVVWAFIGGEGGFSRDEVKIFAKHGFSAVTLGQQVLRVETACVTLVGILKYELDLMR